MFLVYVLFGLITTLYCQKYDQSFNINNFNKRLFELQNAMNPTLSVHYLKRTQKYPELGNQLIGNINLEKLDGVTEGDIIKNKVHSLAKDSKRDLDQKLQALEKVHSAFKPYTRYKIGYLVGYINRTYDEYNEFYNAMEQNKNLWKPTRTLEGYEELKQANTYLTDSLRSLLALIEKDTKGKMLKLPTPRPFNRFSYSYYDDS